MESIAEGALLFLQYDDILGGAACVVWSVALYTNVAGRTSIIQKMVMVMKGMLVWGIAGSVGLAVATLWLRDETVLETKVANKKDL